LEKGGIGALLSFPRGAGRPPEREKIGPGRTVLALRRVGRSLLKSEKKGGRGTQKKKKKNKKK